MIDFGILILGDLAKTIWSASTKFQTDPFRIRHSPANFQKTSHELIALFYEHDRVFPLGLWDFLGSAEKNLGNWFMSLVPAIDGQPVLHFFDCNLFEFCAKSIGKFCAPKCFGYTNLVKPQHKNNLFSGGFSAWKSFE